MAEKYALDPSFAMQELVTIDSTPPPFGFPGIEMDAAPTQEWSFIAPTPSPGGMS